MHFRKFLLVTTEPDKEFFFRFYDPRVLRIFLPTCDVKQLREFFGPVEKFICEDEDADYGLIYSFDNNKLKTNRIKRAEILDQFEKSNEAKNQNLSNPTQFLEYKRLREKELELLNTVSPSLTPYYKQKVNEYFNSVNK